MRIYIESALATAFLRGKIAGVDTALDSVDISIHNVQRTRSTFIVRWLRTRLDRGERQLLEDLVQSTSVLASLQLQRERLGEIQRKWRRQAAQRRRLTPHLQALQVKGNWVELAPRCRLCGCTDERPCPGGCCWVPDPAGLGDLCSACQPAVHVELAS